MAKLLAVIVVSLVSVCVAADEPNVFEINKLIGRGINIGNALEAPNEGEWGVTIKEEYFNIIKDANFSSVRIAVCWSAHALAEKPYTVDPNFFKRMNWVILTAMKREAIVIVTMHHYNELYENPAAHKERFLAMWKQIAEHYKNYPNALLFEPLNERGLPLGFCQQPARREHQLSLLQRLPDGDCEIRAIAGLEEKTGDATVVDRFDRDVHRSITSHDKTYGVRVSGADMAQESCSRHAGHLFVGYNGVHGLRAEKLNGLLGRCSLPYSKGLLAQCAADAVKQLDVVIHQKDRSIHNFTSPGVCTAV